MATAEPAKLPVEDRSSARLLVVEDQQAVRRLMCLMLRDQGYEVIEAEDGVDALEKVEALSGKIDALLTDLMMPRLDGRSLARQLRGRWPALGVVFTSGYAPDTIDDPSDEPLTEFLPKPFTHQQLIEKVASVLVGDDGSATV